LIKRLSSFSYSILLLTLTLFTSLAYAYTPPLPKTIDISSISTQLDLNGNTPYIEDAQALYSLNNLIKGEYYGEFTQSEGTFNKGITTSAFWFIQKLSNNSPQSAQRILEIPYPPLDAIDVYVIPSNNDTSVMRAGDDRLFSTRPIHDNNYLFPITIPAGEAATLYIRVQSEGSSRVPLILWDKVHFEQNKRQHLLMMGIFFGIMLLMFIYNLCIFTSVRDLSYFFYIGYIASHALLQATITGFSAEYLWPNMPWLNNDATLYSLVSLEFFATGFVAKILNTKDNTPRSHTLLMGLMGLTGGGLLLALTTSFSTALQFLLILAMIMALFGLGIGCHLAIKGHRTARLFLLAWFSFLGGALLYIGITAGVLPATVFTTNALIIGSTFEVAILSWTLADRFHQMQREKIQTEKAANNTLQQANHILTKSHEIKDAFLATISHELRTPMNGILSSIEHIKGEKDLYAQEAFIQSADRSANHMMLLIDSVLSYTEISSNKCSIDHLPFEIRKSLTFIDNYFSSQCLEKGLAFMIDVNDDVPSLILGDQRKVIQVLVSLIDNAIKFTDSGYVRLIVDLHTLEKTTKQVNISFKVQDTGIGIPANLKSEIFERFQQADNSFHRGYGGLGIGLATAKQIASLLNAELTFDSTPKRGSTFCFIGQFEYTQASSKPIQKNHYSINELAQNRVALVVEDNKVNQLVLKTTLAKFGFNVLCANNGKESIEALLNNPVDIVLMDCQMPIMDGFQAARHIRSLSHAKSLTPIIAVTANAMSQDREKCMEAGMNDYMSKPVKTDELKEKLLQWLPLQQPTSDEPPPKQLSTYNTHNSKLS